MKKITFFYEHIFNKCLVSKTKLLLLLTFICSVYCTQINAQQPVGTTFTVSGITYEVTVAGTASANSNREVAVIGYMDIYNLTPTIPSTAHYGGPYNVTSIGEYAFNSYSLTSVTIPSSIITIERGAFNNNALASVTIPTSVTTLGDYAFSNNSLTSITIPSSVTSIGKYAFFYNSLTSVTIPSSVTSIGVSAFGNNLLTSVSIPSSVTSIGGSAFGNNLLTSVTIPSSVTTIGNYAFEGNSSLNAVISESTYPAILLANTFDDNSLIDLTIPLGTTTVYTTANWTGFQSVTEVVQTLLVGDTFTVNDIEYEVTTVGTPNTVSAKDYKGTDTSVDIPSSVTGSSGLNYDVTAIGDAAFNGNSLTSVTIPSSVTSIGNSAFLYNALTSVIMSSSVTVIGDYAFGNNSLTSITIPALVTSIGHYAFGGNSNLTEVISESTNPAILLANVFTDNSNIDLTIPTGTTTAYVAANWIGFNSVTEDATLSIVDSIFNFEIRLYPNPTNSILNIEMNQVFKQATIYSVLGKEVLKTQNKTIDVSSLSKGLFLIKIENEVGNVLTKRFIKE